MCTMLISPSFACFMESSGLGEPKLSLALAQASLELDSVVGGGFGRRCHRPEAGTVAEVSNPYPELVPGRAVARSRIAWVRSYGKLEMENLKRCP